MAFNLPSVNQWKKKIYFGQKKIQFIGNADLKRKNTIQHTLCRCITAKTARRTKLVRYLSLPRTARATISKFIWCVVSSLKIKLNLKLTRLPRTCTNTTKLTSVLRDVLRRQTRTVITGIASLATANPGTTTAALTQTRLCSITCVMSTGYWCALQGPQALRHETRALFI